MHRLQMRFRRSFILLAGLAAAGATASAANSLPVTKQNSLVQDYCAVCHTDASSSGGLTLEHFDGAHASPSVAAMMLAKLTNGITLAKVKRVDSDPEVLALLDKELKNSAINAAGLPQPELDTTHSWISALSAESAGATEWRLASEGKMKVASIVREVVLPDGSKADMYRLALSCRADTLQGGMQLSWSPGGPKAGKEFKASFDGKPPVSYTPQAEGNSGPGDIVLSAAAGMQLPERSLRVTEIADESVEFPFDALPKTARRALSPCFAPAH